MPVHALPFLLSLPCALALAPTLLRELARGGHTAANYRGRQLPCPFGLLILAAALAAGIPLILLARFAHLALFHPEFLAIAVYALGVICLGLIDDTLAAASVRARAAAPRGLRGHAAAAVHGELSTGVLKALGSLALALLALGQLGLSEGRWLLAAGVLVLCTNVFNLLDLRPGRAIKAFVLLGAGLAVGSANVRPLWSLGLLCGPALIAGGYDLRERAMLGDSGASLLGALGGLWIVLTLGGAGQLAALALLAMITLYGEFRSISRLFERMPGLRGLDSLGRPS
jgi:hypothetical protein